MIIFRVGTCTSNGNFPLGYNQQLLVQIAADCEHISDIESIHSRQSKYTFQRLISNLLLRQFEHVFWYRIKDINQKLIYGMWEQNT